MDSNNQDLVNSLNPQNGTSDSTKDQALYQAINMSANMGNVNDSHFTSNENQETTNNQITESVDGAVSYLKNESSMKNNSFRINRPA